MRAMRHSVRTLCLVGIIALAAVATDGSRAFAENRRNSDEESVSVTGGTASNEVDINLSRRRTRAGSGARPVKAPVPKPYSITELKLKSDDRGRVGVNLEGQEGSWCVEKVTTTSTTPIGQSRTNNINNRNNAISALGFPNCPRPPSQVAKDLALKTALPSPVLEIDPGWAITGLRAYLETKGTTSFEPAAVETEWGTMTMHGTGSYFVDWGDNTGFFGPYDFEGLPHPNGRISHKYQFAGTYTVRVRQAWSVTWKVGNRSGVINDRFTETSITLPVTELQAVRVR